jgi:hypothetical protein
MGSEAGATAAAAAAKGDESAPLREGQELDDSFSGLAGADGLFSVAGFGSLLSGRMRVVAPLCGPHERVVYV